MGVAYPTGAMVVPFGGHRGRLRWQREVAEIRSRQAQAHGCRASARAVTARPPAEAATPRAGGPGQVSVPRRLVVRGVPCMSETYPAGVPKRRPVTSAKGRFSWLAGGGSTMVYAFSAPSVGGHRHRKRSSSRGSRSL
jgi:hypothetical protein